jgi:hypothetical protein
MHNQTPSGTSPAAALLRRPIPRAQAQGKPRALSEERAQAGETGGHVCFERGATAIPQYQPPVIETEEFRVVEPDGTEDPWANADDGLVPDPNAADDKGQRKDRD